MLETQMPQILSVNSFILGAVGWWFVTVAIFILLLIFVDKIFWGWSTTCLIAYIMILQFVSKVDVLGFILHHPIKILLYIVGYFLIGTVWSLIKWWLYIRKTLEKVLKNKLERDKRFGVVETTIEERRNDLEINKPTLDENKGRISMWIIYWPFSLILSLIDDFVKRIAHEIVELLRRLYQGMIDKAFNNTEKIYTQEYSKQLERKSK